ncbi:MAG: YraN family protein [Elusimicrobiota bacterium]|jgi:putative endonuclease
MNPESSLGAQGESEAARYLEKNGLRVISRHFQTRWGEIDLICRDQDLLVFVEVKTRTLASHPSAAEAITPAKQKRFLNAALSYIKKHRLEGCALRFDVVLIEAGRVEWIPSAFEAPNYYTL